MFIPVPSRAFPFALVRALSFLKRRVWIIYPLPASSHPSHPVPVISSISIAPPFSPLFDKCGGASFLCLPSCRFAVGAGRSSLPLIGLWRLVISSVSLLLPSGRFVLPVLCLGFLVLALVSSSCRSRCLIISSSFAPVSRYDGRGAWSGLVGACGVERRFHVRMACYHPAPFSPVRAGCLLRRCVPYRPRPVPRAVPLIALLLFVIRPVLRQAWRGDVFRRLFSGGFAACAAACRAWGGGVVSAWRVIISGCSRRGACCVDYVARATACRSCGILILSIGCIYRLIGFLI